MRLAIASCVAVLASASTVEAQTTTRAGAATPTLQAGSPAYNISTFQDLVRVCSTDSTAATFPGAIGVCAGYISGVLDHHLVDGRRNRRVCLPADRPTRMETLQSLVSWEHSNQRYADEPAAEGVMRYFMTNYPCGAPHSVSGTSRTPG
jgi:hypothetical protein